MAQRGSTARSENPSIRGRVIEVFFRMWREVSKAPGKEDCVPPRLIWLDIQ